MTSLTINGKVFDTDVEPDTPLLWAIRENAGLTGTKYGCGIALCGACMEDTTTANFILSARHSNESFHSRFRLTHLC